MAHITNWVIICYRSPIFRDRKQPLIISIRSKTTTSSESPFFLYEEISLPKQQTPLQLLYDEAAIQGVRHVFLSSWSKAVLPFLKKLPQCPPVVFWLQISAPFRNATFRFLQVGRISNSQCLKCPQNLSPNPFMEKRYNLPHMNGLDLSPDAQKYGIFTYIWPKFMVNIGQKYPYHWAYDSIWVW